MIFLPMQGWRLGRLMEGGVSIEGRVVVVEDCIVRHNWIGHYRLACGVHRLAILRVCCGNK